MLKSIRVRNFRSFSSSEKNEFINIKPLTVLIGKNSSGKSSVLRVFPLLRQSVETETTGPILWFGSYVDFGAFSEVKNNDQSDEKIHFDFKLLVNVNEHYNYNASIRKAIMKETGFDGRIEIKVTVSVAEENKKTVAKNVNLDIGDEKFFFEFQKQEKGVLYFNGQDININYFANNSFTPTIGKFTTRKIFLHDGKETTIKTFDENFLSDFFFKDSMPSLKKYFHKNTSIETIEDGIDKIGLCNKDTLFLFLRYIFNDNKVFMKNLNSNKDEILELFYKTIVRYNIQHLLDSINRELSQVFQNVRYIAPLRATAERYYRHQDLQVNEINHTGSNLAMLLRALSDSQQKDFSQWTEANFGFSIRVEELGLHYALKIKNMYDSHEYNINDMGFGFSQILPIVASIWFETSLYRGHSNYVRYRRNQQLIFTIEQPELHLHPEFQARLAKLFAKVIEVSKKSNSNISIVFETHSKTMIDVLGECIEDNILSTDDVNIVIFEKGQGNKFSNISFSEFDNEGDLVHWPIGFFAGSDL